MILEKKRIKSEYGGEIKEYHREFGATTSSTLRLTNSTLRLTNSTLRLTNSTLRLTNSTLRLTNSTLRLTNSTLRLTNSTLRLTNSTLRLTNSTLRLTNSTLRLTTVMPCQQLKIHGLFYSTYYTTFGKYCHRGLLNACEMLCYWLNARETQTNRSAVLSHMYQVNIHIMYMK